MKKPEEMITSIANILDIPIVPEEIIKAASRGRLVIFVGAGVSRLIGCPSWREFAEKHLQYVYEKKCINYHEYVNLKKLDTRKILSICRSILEKNGIGPPDNKAFLDPKPRLKTKYNIFKNIYDMNAIYVTTNYDGNLDEFVKNRLTPVSTEIDPSIDPTTISTKPTKGKVLYLEKELLISELTNGNVIHLHGSAIDERSLIITVDDYLRLYETDKNPAVLLTKIFNNYTVLFVGYGLEEYEILEFMINKSRVASQELRHYMLYPIFEEEINLLRFHKTYYEKLGINLISYPIGQNGHEHLDAVIEEWAKIIGIKSKPQKFLDRRNIIDEAL
ncbi:MAG: SIR2 family protein [Actinobacteria bacterium]|nr:SIR2 family protein [Actinomycetota bacterium]